MKELQSPSQRVPHHLALPVIKASLAVLTLDRVFPVLKMLHSPPALLTLYHVIPVLKRLHHSPPALLTLYHVIPVLKMLHHSPTALLTLYHVIPVLKMLHHSPALDHVIPVLKVPCVVSLFQAKHLSYSLAMLPKGLSPCPGLGLMPIRQAWRVWT